MVYAQHFLFDKVFLDILSELEIFQEKYLQAHLLESLAQHSKIEIHLVSSVLSRVISNRIPFLTAKKDRQPCHLNCSRL